MDTSGGIISFNVGGKVIQVYRQTLKQFPNSLLWKLANGELKHNQDNDGLIFLDRNAKIFKQLLDLVRYQCSDLVTANSATLNLLKQDLYYYNLPELLPLLETPILKQLKIEVVEPVKAVNASTATDVPDDPLILLSVGGIPYTTSLTTLTRYPASMLGAMFSGRLPSRSTSDGRVFIDRDGALFRHVLNFLRTGELTVSPSCSEFEAVAREADFYQIAEMIEAVERCRIQKGKAIGQRGVYLEVKDSIICFRGFHISTSLVGPMQQLCKVSPFREEFHRTGSNSGSDNSSGEGGGPSLWCNINPFYTAWSKGCIEEVYLNSDSSISRLEWASRLREYGWQLVNTSSCCSSTSDQTYIVVDKWFIPEMLPPPAHPSVHRQESSTSLSPSAAVVDNYGVREVDVVQLQTEGLSLATD